MTPEETLDWLAQQHFDQCREERPIQNWIRKMKSQLPEQQEPVAHMNQHGVIHEAGYPWEPTNRLEPLYTTPPQRKPLTDEMVLAGARALAKRHADSCGLDFDDVWKYYADEHKDDAKVVIEAAHGIKEKNT